MAGVVSCAQLRQLEMQLEQEYEEKQMVLHEKQDLEGLIGTLCEQVRGRCPPQGQPGRAVSGKGTLSSPRCYLLANQTASPAVPRKKGSVDARVWMERQLGCSCPCSRLRCPPSPAPSRHRPSQQRVPQPALAASRVWGLRASRRGQLVLLRPRGGEWLAWYGGIV